MNAPVRRKAAPTPPPEIIDSETFLRRWSPKSFLVKGIIEEGRLLTLTGPTGTGKTAVALLLAKHIATGTALGGLRVRDAGVLFLAGENPDDVRTRWLAMLRREMLDPASVDVRFVEGRFSLEEHAGVIRGHLERRPAGLVIVDTLQAFFEGDDSNANEQMKTAAFGFREIASGGPAVLIPAHPTKGAAKDQNVPYGGGALLNEVDGNLSLWRSQGAVELHWCRKFRGSFEPLHFALDTGPVPDALDADGDPVITVTARVILPEEAEAHEDAVNAELRVLLQALKDHPGASLRVLSDACKANGAGWSKSNIDRKLTALAAQGLVRKELGALSLTEAGSRALKAGCPA